MWAMKNDLGADKYDPVDFYQVDSVYYLDNTCGWIFGESQADLPNLCSVLTGAPTASDGACQPGTPSIVDQCYKWDPDTCSWGWDFSCIN